jgi:hypothetical protein
MAQVTGARTERLSDAHLQKLAEDPRNVVYRQTTDDYKQTVQECAARRQQILRVRAEYLFWRKRHPDWSDDQLRTFLLNGRLVQTGSDACSGSSVAHAPHRQQQTHALLRGVGQRIVPVDHTRTVIVSSTTGATAVPLVAGDAAGVGTPTPTPSVSVREVVSSEVMNLAKQMAKNFAASFEMITTHSITDTDMTVVYYQLDLAEQVASGQISKEAAQQLNAMYCSKLYIKAKPTKHHAATTAPTAPTAPTS